MQSTNLTVAVSLFREPPIIHRGYEWRFNQDKGLSWAICSGCLLRYAASCRPHRVAAVNERWLQSQRQMTSPAGLSTCP